MAAEKLPPDGYVLGPGWEASSRAPFCSARPKNVGDCLREVAYTDEGEGVGTCTMHSLAMGAIVRKAEAPTHAFEPSRFGDYCGREVDGDYCKRGRAHAVHEASKAEAPTFEQVLEGATAALEVLGTGALREKLVTEGPRTYAAPPEQPSGNAGELPAEAPKHRYGCATAMRGGECDCAVSGCLNCAAGQSAEAAAAPVGEPSEARRLAHSASVSWWDADGGRCDPEHFDDPDGGPVTGEYTHCNSCDEVTALIQRAIDPRDARIAALEAELAARLVERDGWMEAAAKSEREKGALEAELAEAKRGTLVVAETAYGATQAAVQAEREVWKARIMRFRDDGHMLQSDLFAYLNSDGNEEADRIKNGDPAP